MCVFLVGRKAKITPARWKVIGGVFADQHNAAPRSGIFNQRWKGSSGAGCVWRSHGAIVPLGLGEAFTNVGRSVKIISATPALLRLFLN